MNYNQNRAINLFGSIIGNEISHIVYMEPVKSKSKRINRRNKEVKFGKK